MPIPGGRICSVMGVKCKAVSEITNEKNEKARDDVPDVPPAAVRIPRQFDLINEMTFIMDFFRAILTT